MERIEALVKFLALEIELEEGEKLEDYIEESSYTENEFSEVGSNRSYLVVTEAEAEEKAKEYIQESLWAFNASFLSDQTGLPEEVFTALQPQCEDSNAAIAAIVAQCVDGGLEEFASAAISADGVAHFLNTYDGEEHQEGEWFIYRTN